MENFSHSSSENTISAGAFRCAFTVKFQRNVAFPMEIIAFVRSGDKMSQARLREAT